MADPSRGHETALRRIQPRLMHLARRRCHNALNFFFSPNFVATYFVPSATPLALAVDRENICARAKIRRRSGSTRTSFRRPNWPVFELDVARQDWRRTCAFAPRTSARPARHLTNVVYLVAGDSNAPPNHGQSLSHLLGDTLFELYLDPGGSESFWVVRSRRSKSSLRFRTNQLALREPGRSVPLLSARHWERDELLAMPACWQQ